MEQWQDAASRQVRLFANCLNELLSHGFELLRSGLGEDLGLEPGCIPPWVILLAACAGLVLMVALWASACRAIFKKRPPIFHVNDGIEVKKSAAKNVIKSEEQKKKKKKAEKKAQPNGRVAAEPREEASQEMVPHHQSSPPEIKAEKVPEVKKSKKKAKQAVKETKTPDGKDPEEGTWETKVSNKEKREQRKKDKTSSDGSASPGGVGTPDSALPEPPKASAAPSPAGHKKKKGESTKVKADTVEALVSQVNISEATVMACGVPDVAVKVPHHTVGPKTGHWTASREPASLWGTELDGSWTVVDNGMQTSDLNLVSFTGLGVGAADSQSVSDLPWLNKPRVDDEWLGLNGSSMDPSSDWNAPSEAWGNYEEPTAEPPPAQEQPIPEPATVNLLTRAAGEDDEEKEKAETATDGTAKTKKKKKKKKKKAAEEGGETGQAEEPEREEPAPPVKQQQPVLQKNSASVQAVKAAAVEAGAERLVKDNISQKPPISQVPQKPTDGEPTAKHSNLPAPTQQTKPDENQAPKPAKKKKARRET